jgi:hypothetical protein
MFAKLAQGLTNARTQPPHRPPALLRLIVNRPVRATKHPDRGRLICRWREMPGGAGLTCAWEIEIANGHHQPQRLATQPAMVLQGGDGPQGPLGSHALRSPSLAD